MLRVLRVLLRCLAGRLAVVVTTRHGEGGHDLTCIMKTGEGDRPSFGGPRFSTSRCQRGGPALGKSGQQDPLTGIYEPESDQPSFGWSRREVGERLVHRRPTLFCDGCSAMVHCGVPREGFLSIVSHIVWCVLGVVLVTARVRPGPGCGARLFSAGLFRRSRVTNQGLVSHSVGFARGQGVMMNACFWCV